MYYQLNMDGGFTESVQNTSTSLAHVFDNLPESEWINEYDWNPNNTIGVARKVRSELDNTPQREIFYYGEVDSLTGATFVIEVTEKKTGNGDEREVQGIRYHTTTEDGSLHEGACAEGGALEGVYPLSVGDQVDTSIAPGFNITQDNLPKPIQTFLGAVGDAKTYAYNDQPLIIELAQSLQNQTSWINSGVRRSIFTSSGNSEDDNTWQISVTPLDEGDYIVAARAREKEMGGRGPMAGALIFNSSKPRQVEFVDKEGNRDEVVF